MKKQMLTIIVLLFIAFHAVAQPPVPLPKHIIAQPQANVKLLELTDVVSGRWRGARITQLAGAVNVDSVWLEMKKNGTLSFKHQQYEFNGPSEGTYTITKNKIVISCIKFPFTHTLTGEWDIKTGAISGNYVELKEKDSSQPSYYVPGRNTGTFTLKKY